MRKQIVAGNWKMNTTLDEGIRLAKEVREAVKQQDIVAGVLLAPPFTHLAAVARVLEGSGIAVGAQNCATESRGAFTGEVSAAMIRSCGATHVIIGHSERRSYFREEDHTLLKKLAMAFENGLTPIFCCGELLGERQAGRHLSVVSSQLENTLFSFDKDTIRQTVIAYEPVWAIGTGVNATPAQAQEMHRSIRALIAGKYGQTIADDIPILYGGSCKASNAPDLFINEDVDGGLIGGASLNAQEFLGIIRAMKHN